MSGTVLVTGASGFIGRHAVAALRGQGLAVRALCRRPPEPPVDGVEVVPGDVRDRAALDAAMAGTEAVIHLAARVSFRDEDRAEVLDVNAGGTRSVLQAAVAAGVGRVVVAGSAITLGVTARPVTRDESAPPAPGANPYAASKCEVESIARSFALGGLDVVVVCPTTVYGPGDRTLNSGTLIGRIARGGVIPVPPGGCNVVDVRDVASGVVAALRRGRSGERYVLGGWNLTFREVFRTVASVTAASPLLVPIPAAARQPAMLAARLLQLVRDNPLLAPDLIGNLFGYKHACSDKARGELGWTAARPFRRSVEDAWTFYRREGLL